MYYALNEWNVSLALTPIDGTTTFSPLLDHTDWNLFAGHLPEGDGKLMYVGKNGPLGCIRLANIRDGLEDHQYLAMLKNISGGAAWATALPVTTNLTHFSTDPAVLRAQRQHVAELLEKHTK